jgi:hypothetical protein
MEREPEYGICRLIQTWVAERLRTSDAVRSADAQVESQDEGDYEAKLMQGLAKHRGIMALVSVLGLARGTNGLWEVALEVQIQEQVNMNRSGPTNEWTAMRFAEMVLATFHTAQMPSAPFAYFQASQEAIALEVETPVLVYRVRFAARLGSTLTF